MMDALAIIGWIGLLAATICSALGITSLFWLHVGFGDREYSPWRAIAIPMFCWLALLLATIYFFPFTIGLKQ